MGILDAKTLMSRHEDAMKDRDLWRHLYRDAYRYGQPHRDTVERTVTKGEPRTDLVFDSTAVKSIARSANRLQDLIFPAGKLFVKPEPGPRFDEADDAQKRALRNQLEEINERFHAAIWRSNFQAAINEAIQDLFIGTGALLMNEGPQWDPFHFTAVPQFLIGVREGPWGTISDVSREVRLHPSVAKQTWPDAEIPQDQVASEQTDGNKRHYVEITYADFENGPIGGGQVAPQPAKWWYTVLDKTEGKKLVKDREMPDVSPWIVVRWLKSPEEIRGRGPVLQSIGHIRTVNKVTEFILKNASIAIGGLWTAVDDGVFKPRTTPFTTGSVIPVASNGGTRGPSIMPLEFPGNFDVSQLVLEDLRAQIKEALFDSNLPPVAGPVRTATEFIERLRDLTMDIGPAAGRIQKELLEPLYLRGLLILAKKGIIDLPAEIALNSQNIRLTVVSPLAQRQALDDIQSVVQWLELSSFLGPELVALKVRIDKLPEWLGAKLGVPPELIRDEVDEQQVLQVVGDMIAAAQNQPAATNGAAVNGTA